MLLQQPGISAKKRINGFTACKRSFVVLTAILAVWFLFIPIVARNAYTVEIDDLVQDPAMRTHTSLLGPADAPVPEIDGRAYVLYDPLSQTFLLGENPDEPLPPASITKVMTALLALENMQLTDTIAITRDMFATIPNDYTRLGLVEGEIITVDEALHASLLISANDAAMALAIAMGGSVAGFSDMMNARARELGCLNTHFTNPYGFADPEHLTTASDMALITAEALGHAAFCEITTQKHHLMQPTNMCAETRGLPNGNRFVATTQYAYEGYQGGKTGYTRLSRYTIVAGAGQDDRQLVGVILGASNAPVRYANLIDLFAYGFSSFATEQVDPAELDERVQQAVAQVAAEMERGERSFAIARVTLHVIAYVTTHQAAGSYAVQLDPDRTEVALNRTEQLLQYALYRQYTDGRQVPVGVLELVVQDQPAVQETTATTTQLAASQTTTEPISQGVAGGSLLLRYLLVGLLILILIFALLMLAGMIKRDLKRKRRGKRRTVL